MCSQHKHVVRIAAFGLRNNVISIRQMSVFAWVPGLAPHVVRFSRIEITVISAFSVLFPESRFFKAVPFASVIPAVGIKGPSGRTAAPRVPARLGSSMLSYITAATAPAAPARADFKPNSQVPREMRAMLPVRVAG